MGIDRRVGARKPQHRVCVTIFAAGDDSSVRLLADVAPNVASPSCGWVCPNGSKRSVAERIGVVASLWESPYKAPIFAITAGGVIVIELGHGFRFFQFANNLVVAMMACRRMCLPDSHFEARSRLPVMPSRGNESAAYTPELLLVMDPTRVVNKENL
jgi:hypothetical protein